jgi:hypothetical protein
MHPISATPLFHIKKSRTFALYIIKQKEKTAMRKLAFMFAFILCVLSIKAADISAISNAFKSGDAASLAGNMDTEVDIATPGTNRKGNSTETIAVLTRFFQANKPSGFTVVHQADKKETGFLVGKLATGKGEFRVNITYCTKNDKVLIQSIRIE